MKHMLFAMVAASALAASAAGTSTPAGFTDDMDAALKSAKDSGRLVYACFSGSDWCGWCKKLDKEVFSKPGFVDSVTNDYVLVYVDSPSNKALLSEKAQKANPKLVEKYRIQGFPTALVLDADGNEIAKTGYRRGGSEKYAKHLKSLKKNGAEIKRLRDEIDKLEHRVEALENEE